MITVHYTTVPGRPWCGAYGHTRLTTDLAEVTCVRCLRYLHRDGLDIPGNA